MYAMQASGGDINPAFERRSVAEKFQYEDIAAGGDPSPEATY